MCCLILTVLRDPYHNTFDFNIPPATGLNLLITMLTAIAIVGAAIGLSFVPWQSLFARIRQAFEPRDNALNENPVQPFVSSNYTIPTILLQEAYVLPRDAPVYNAYNDLDSIHVPIATLVHHPDTLHEEEYDLPCEEDLEDFVPPFYGH